MELYMTKAQKELIRELRTRTVDEWGVVSLQTRMIRKRITDASGKWDAAKVLRRIRYAK